MTRAEFTVFLRAEDTKWAPLVRKSGMTSL